MRAVVRRGLAIAMLLGLGVLLFQPAPLGAQMNWPTDQDYTYADQLQSAWILPRRTYGGNRYVDFAQVTAQNVGQLQVAWKYAISDISGSGQEIGGQIETSPIIWNGTVYITSAHNHVYAVDLKTGAPKWEFSYAPHPFALVINRGVALKDGKVYIGALDGHLIALNAETGQTVWNVQGAHDVTNTFYSMQPVPYKNMILEGASNGDWGGRGYISAFNAQTGERLWDWYTVPGPGEPGNETWGGNSWQRGGATVWSGAGIDPDTNTIFLSLGNPQPDFLGTVREGANLYSDSIVALDISGATPRLKWYHQMIPHDTHDWDPAMPPLFFHGVVNGQLRALVAAGDKAGNFDVLDANTGTLVHRTVLSVQKGYFTPPSLTGTIACPETSGGVEFNGGTYDPATNSFLVPSNDECGLWKSYAKDVYVAGQFYIDGQFPTNVGPANANFYSVDVSTGKVVWRHQFPVGSMSTGGVLVTSTGLAFMGLTDGTFNAFEIRTGKLLWQFQTGASILAPPVSVMVDGKEYILVASGAPGFYKRDGLASMDPHPFLTVFALP
jgi:alcohol dehydrogenase (cytochrome c)